MSRRGMRFHIEGVTAPLFWIGLLRVERAPWPSHKKTLPMLKSLLKDIYSRRPASRDDDMAVATDDSQARERWLDGVLHRMFQLMHTSERDNFDADRYRNEPANAFFADRHAGYFAFLLKNSEHFFRSRQLFEDETSRELYDQLILFRVLGHLHVRLPFNTAENRAQLATAERWRVEDTEDVGAFGPLSIFVVPGDGND